LRSDEPAASEDADNGAGGRAIWKHYTRTSSHSANVTWVPENRNPERPIPRRRELNGVNLLVYFTSLT